jgi:serine O-acetyltransferase
MIQTREQLKHVLSVEEKIYDKKWYYDLPICLTEYQILYKHMKYLRKAEYAYNNGRRLSRYYYLIKLLRIQTRYAISIPLNVVEEGFEIVHLGSVIINAKAKVGKNCKIHPGAVIGANHDLAPKIGEHVYIGPGAKIFGDIVIADDVQIGANAVVNKSCTQKGAILVGVPAHQVEDRS